MLKKARAADPPHAGDDRRRGRRAVVRALRGRRPRRRRRQAARRPVRRGPAHDGEGEAPPDRRLRGRGHRACTRTARASARCSSVSTTTRASSTTSGSPAASRRRCGPSSAKFLQPYRKNALEGHPWREWADAAAQAEPGSRMPGGLSRWNAGKDLSWDAVRPELVAEVAYEHLQGDRFRHTARFQRWRPDRDPELVHLRAARHPGPGRTPRGLRSVRPRRAPDAH